MNSETALHVLVTRPLPAGEVLSELLRQQGDIASYFPTIVFADLTATPAFQATLQTLDQQTGLIFISPQAVYASAVAIRQAWPDLTKTVKLAAVGAGTAQVLREAGLWPVIYPVNEVGSMGLLALPAFQQCHGKKFMIVRGEGGRESLADTLIERGAVVSHLVAYQRQLPKVDVSSYQQLLQQGSIDVVVITSGEGLRNLVQCLGEQSLNFLRSTPLIVVSERIKKLAEDLGFQTIWVAQEAGHTAILNLLAQRRSAICQMKQRKS